ncbi:MAG: hypothetical protein IIV90_04645 [Oscillospiraceae bacterium]|nr:hypothetical protein [Oscillospiraceae bacterium]
MGGFLIFLCFFNPQAAESHLFPIWNRAWWFFCLRPANTPRRAQKKPGGFRRPAGQKQTLL